MFLIADNISVLSNTGTYLFCYGSPEVEKQDVEITSAEVASDRLSVRLRCAGELREGYVHELHLDGVRDVSGEPLLHPRAYYTLVVLPAVE